MIFGMGVNRSPWMGWIGTTVRGNHVAAGTLETAASPPVLLRGRRSGKAAAMGARMP